MLVGDWLADARCLAVADAVRDAAAELERLGAVVEEVELAGPAEAFERDRRAGAAPRPPRSTPSGCAERPEVFAPDVRHAAAARRGDHRPAVRAGPPAPARLAPARARGARRSATCCCRPGCPIPAPRIADSDPLETTARLDPDDLDVGAVADAGGGGAGRASSMGFRSACSWSASRSPRRRCWRPPTPTSRPPTGISQRPPHLVRGRRAFEPRRPLPAPNAPAARSSAIPRRVAAELAQHLLGVLAAERSARGAAARRRSAQRRGDLAHRARARVLVSRRRRRAPRPADRRAPARRR